ncbi:MAG: acyl-ACP--UDP-N-acetylglucosamine O-acyltransferase [Burkholderiales bacterium]
MIHPAALVAAGARIDADVEIGAYTIIGPEVEIGRGTRIGPHAVITGRTKIGEDNHIFQFVSLGDIPQDKKYQGEKTRLEIGDRNTIREFCTFNTGTAQDATVTRLGDDNWMMAYVHLAHDCQVGNHTVFANNAQLAGHVQVGDQAILGAYTGVHQYCRIGAHAMIAAASIVLQDVPPFVMAAGNSAAPRGLNVEGLQRRGFDSERMAQLKRAYKTLYRSGYTLDEAKERLSQEQGDDVRRLLEFIEQSRRGIIR